MSGENKAAGELLRYVQSDFSSGYALLEAGINNVISAIVNGEINGFTVRSAINKGLLVELIKSCRKDVQFFTKAEDNLLLKVDGISISVSWKDGCIIFKQTTQY